MFLYLNPRAFRCLSAPSFFVVPSMWRLSSTTAATVARPQLQLPSKQAADGHWKPKGRRNSPNIYIYDIIYIIIYIIIYVDAHPRWELAGGETGRGIYHRRWDIQDWNWQVGRREEVFTTGDGTSKMGTSRWGDGKRNLPQEMGHPRWELAGRETGRGIYHRRWDIQDGNWQVGRREEEFTTWHGTSKMGTGR